MLGAMLFVLGFSVVFIVVAVTVSTAGTLLVEHQSLLMRLGGVLVILMALVFLGSERLGALSTWRPGWKPAAGLAGAPLLAWSSAWGGRPAPADVRRDHRALDGAVGRPARRRPRHRARHGLLAGLGLPFLLIAGGYSRAGQASRWLREHYRAVQITGGVLLLVVGVLLVTGLWR